MRERLEAEQPRTEKTDMALSLLRDGEEELLQKLALLDQGGRTGRVAAPGNAPQN
jgi:hypothetical protein